MASEPYASPDIRKATIEDAPAVADILTEAFADDPIMNWMFGGPRPIGQLFKEMTGDVYLAQGFGHIAGDGAATLWLPPGGSEKLPFMNEVRLAASMFRSGGFGALYRARETARVMEASHPKHTHYYLFSVGVRKTMQGKGLGGKIIREGLKQADSEEIGAYLENSNPRNTPLYERLGFEARAPLALPDGAPPLLAMWRPVASPS